MVESPKAGPCKNFLECSVVIVFTPPSPSSLILTFLRPVLRSRTLFGPLFDLKTVEDLVLVLAPTRGGGRRDEEGVPLDVS